MALKHIKKLKDDLFNTQVKRFEALESEINSLTRDSMVDPEDVEEALRQLRAISTYIQNISTTLLAAQVPHVFNKSYESFMTLNKSLTKTRDTIKEEGRGLELLEGYDKKLSEIEPFFKIYLSTKDFMSLPKADKKYKAWKKNGLIKNNLTYLPFFELNLMLNTLDNYLKNNF